MPCKLKAALVDDSKQHVQKLTSLSHPYLVKVFKVKKVKKSDCYSFCVNNIFIELFLYEKRYALEGGLSYTRVNLEKKSFIKCFYEHQKI